MLPCHQPDRIRIAFDDHRLVADAGLILRSTLALRLGLPQLVDRHLDLNPQTTGLRPGRTAHPLGTPPHPASATALALGNPVQSRPGPAASHSTPSLTAPVRQCSNVPANSRQSGPRAPLAASYPAISLTTADVSRHRRPQKRLQTARQPPVYPNSIPDHPRLLLPPPVSSPRPSLSIGGFELSARYRLKSSW